MIKIVLIVSLLLTGMEMFAQEKNSKDRANIEANMLRRSRPFLSSADKLTMIKSAKIKKPASIKAFSEQMSIDNNPATLSLLKMTALNAYLGFNTPSRVAMGYAELGQSPGSSMFLNFGSNFGGQQQVDTGLYLIEINLFFVGIVVQTMPQFTISTGGETLFSTAVPTANPRDEYYKVVFLFPVDKITELDISCSTYPWVFQDCQITKINQ